MIDLKIHINNGKDIFAPFEPTLVSWLHVVREYADRAPKDKDGKKDYFSFYKERPQVGFFAIAAWLNGWAVLQEWETEKKIRGVVVTYGLVGNKPNFLLRPSKVGVVLTKAKTALMRIFRNTFELPKARQPI